MTLHSHNWLEMFPSNQFAFILLEHSFSYNCETQLSKSLSLKLFTEYWERTSHKFSDGFSNSWCSPVLDSFSFLHFEYSNKEQTCNNLFLLLILFIFQNSLKKKSHALKWHIIIPWGYNRRHKKQGCLYCDSWLCLLQCTRISPHRVHISSFWLTFWLRLKSQGHWQKAVSSSAQLSFHLRDRNDFPNMFYSLCCCLTLKQNVFSFICMWLPAQTTQIWTDKYFWSLTIRIFRRWRTLTKAVCLKESWR